MTQQSLPNLSLNVSSVSDVDISGPVNFTSSDEEPQIEGDLGDLLLDGFDIPDPEPLGELHPRITDDASAAEGLEILRHNSTQNIAVIDNTVVIRSRVLKDVFHVFNMFYISTTHGLRLDFVQALRDAIFIPDKDDKRQIIAWASKQDPPQTWDQLLRKKAKWLWRHCKRAIPPPESLYPLVDTVFKTYGPLKDSKTGAPLFNLAAWKTAKNVLELIRNGFVSDPPGIPLYYPLGADAKAGGLSIYGCYRGTNHTENIHTHLMSRLPTSGSGIRHLLACIQDFILRHNLLVGTYNSTGQRYRGHDCIWLTNQIQEMQALVGELVPDSRPTLSNWINGNLYIPTSEVSVFGLLRVWVNTTQVLTQNSVINFLASHQGTRKPVLPVNTPEERQLFTQLMSKETAFNSTTAGPNWTQGVKIWNRKAEYFVNDRVSYKVMEHLKGYYADWKTNVGIKQSMSVTAPNQTPLLTKLRHPDRSLQAPPVPQKPLQPLVVTKGFLPLSQPLWQLPPTPSLSAEPDSQISPFYFMPMPGPVETPMQNSTSHLITATHDHSSMHQNMLQLSKNRAQATFPKKAVKKQRKGRTCAKCAQEDCDGKKAASLCHNPCRHCKKHSCRGRNSKTPNKVCTDAWA
ncbi:hypothetical protein C8R44DRAFT_748066 [Mycena epipterygia]|nr:hypothetical protein C8R44DRAFT_748066 [Mycena epipterygia]